VTGFALAQDLASAAAASFEADATHLRAGQVSHPGGAAAGACGSELTAPANPPECLVCALPFEFVPSCAPRAMPTVVDLTDTQRKRVLEWHLQSCRRTAFHEAGHAIVGLAHGRELKFVQAGQNPHASFLTGPLIPSVVVRTKCAGEVGAAVADGRLLLPSHSEMLAAVERARMEQIGSCDLCVAALLLVRERLGASDAELVEYWKSLWRQTIDLLDDIFVRAQLIKLAGALLEHIHLRSADIGAIVDTASLQAVRRELFVEAE